MNMIYEFVVRVTVLDSEETSWGLVAEHIKESVQSWGGSYPPEHPLFPPNIAGVAVTTHRKRRSLKK